MSILALDFGLKHIGVALAEGPLAQPLRMVPRSNAVAFIAELCDQFNVQEIVIGLPEGPVRSEVEHFVNQELRVLRFPIHVVDETLSSHDARQALLHTSQKNRREGEHAAAAAIMLQRWLDEKNNK